MIRPPASIVKEIHKLRTALLVARRSLARLSRHVVAAQANPGGDGRTRPRLSPRARASMVLQGRYMDMRQLKPRQKAQVRKIKMGKGVRAAIERAKEMTHG